MKNGPDISSFRYPIAPCRSRLPLLFVVFISLPCTVYDRVPIYKLIFHILSRLRYSGRWNVDVDKLHIVYLHDYISFPRQWNVV